MYQGERTTMSTKPQTSTTAVIEIDPILTVTADFAIIGRTPMIQNRLAEKARQELLLPKGRKTAADKAMTLKHDPIAEFRASAYILHDTDRPTHVGFPSAQIKRAMMDSALRLPGAKKTEIAQLVHVENVMTELYGLPEVFCAITRSADMNRTPDVRTRAIYPEWAAVVSITYTVPFLTERSVLNLLAAAGQICGIGDWRLQKGGSYGAFRVTDPQNDTKFQQIVASCSRA